MDGATSHKEKTEIILKLLDFFLLILKTDLLHSQRLVWDSQRRVASNMCVTMPRTVFLFKVNFSLLAVTQW